MAFDANGVWRPELPGQAAELPPGVAAPTPGVPVASPLGLVPAPDVAAPTLIPNVPVPAQSPPVPVQVPPVIEQQPAGWQAPPPVAVPPPPAPTAAVPETPGTVATHESPNQAQATGGGGIVPPSLKDELAQQAMASGNVTQAYTDLGQSQAAESDAEAQARAHGAELMQAQQERLQAAQAQRDADTQRINEEQTRAYQEAHDTTIPDFYAGRPGAMVAGAISMALGEAGRGLTAFATGANIGNTAKDVIDNAIKQYFVQQKEKVDNLFKFAEAKNRLGEEQKALWAQKLNDLQFQMAAVHQSVADKVLEVAAAAKGRVDQSQAKVLAETHAQQGVQLQIQARKDAFNMQAKKRELGISAYNAETGRINALAAKEEAAKQKVEVSLNQLIDKNAQALHKDLIGSGTQAGPVQVLAGVEAVKHTLREAAADKDPNKLAGAMTAAVEQAGKILAGGKTTTNQAKMIKDLATVKDQIQAKAGSILGGSTVGQTYLNRVVDMLDAAAQEAKQTAAQGRERFLKAHLGPGGFAGSGQLDQAGNERLKARVLNHLEQITGSATYNGQPIFQEGGAPEQGSAAPAPQQTPVGTRATSGGKPIVMTANGWQLVQ